MIGKLTMAGLGLAATVAALTSAPPTAQAGVAAVTTAVPATAAPVPAATSIVAAPSPVDGQADRLRAVAERELDRLGDAIPKHDRVAIVDFSRPSAEPRLFLVDLTRGSVAAFRVSHGRGSDPAHSGRLLRFSGVDGSEATSRGAYRTAELYTGGHGRSLRLDGLDPDNRSARARAIVVHAAAYAEPGVVAAQGRLGRSQGCFAVAGADLAPVLDFLGAGRLLFADRL